MSETVTLEWAQGRLVAARLRVPSAGTVVLRTRSDEHLLFGICDTLHAEDGTVLGRLAAVDWAAPQQIPPLDAPGALPPGAGTAVLNLLATQARAAGVSRLRYRGPYPTAALFDALTECFTVVDEPEVALELFTRQVRESALVGVSREVPVDFVPAPFKRRFVSPQVCVQHRDGLEKVFLGARGYVRDGVGPSLLRPDGPNWQAVMEIGGVIYAHVATFAADGALLEGPEPVGACTSPVVGRPLPQPVRVALLGAAIALAPALLQPLVHEHLTATTMRWADTGDVLARSLDDCIEVHAALFDNLAERPEELLRAVADAITPIALRHAQSCLSQRMSE